MWQTEISNYGSFLAECFHLKMKKLLETSPFYACIPKAKIFEVRFLRYKVRQFFVILGNFFPFTPLTTHKIKILKKWRKHLEKSSFYTCVPKIKVVWCMLPEIWSVTGTIFYQFRPLFCPFTLTILKIKIWKKKKKTLEDIIFLQKYTINEDHMMYGSWDIKVWRTEFFVISSHFFPLTLLTTLKIKNQVLHLCTTSNSIWWMLPEIWSATDIIFCHFGSFFVL